MATGGNTRNTRNTRNSRNSTRNTANSPGNWANANTLPDRVATAAARRLPLSGSEEPFSDMSLFSARRGKDNNNCYAWAIDKYANSGDTKLQPGNLSRAAGTMNLSSCGALRQRTLADLKGRAYAEVPEKPCRTGYYKVMAFLAKNEDYHWYRQHKDALVRMTDKMRDMASLSRALGVRPSQLQAASASPKRGDMVLVKDADVWSHKQGFATPPMLKDACGKVITDPRRACRDYGRLNYSDYCGSFCVRTRGAGGR